MGQEKEQQIHDQEAAERRMKREGKVCYICGGPAPHVHEKWGRVCAYDADKLDRE